MYTATEVPNGWYWLTKYPNKKSLTDSVEVVTTKTAVASLYLSVASS